MSAYRGVFVAVGIVLLTATGSAQVGLPELAAKLGQPFSRPRIRELVPVTVDELAREADLVVHGIVTPVGSHLSPKGTEIYTDYRVTPRAVLYSRVGVPQQRSVPGPLDVVFTQYGGTMTFDGIRVDCFDEQLPLLDASSEVLLFLKHQEGTAIYEIVGGIAAFRVQDGRVRGLVRPASILRSLDGASVSELSAKIAALKRP